MLGTTAGSGAGRVVACGEWSPAPPSLNGRPGTALHRGQTLVRGSKPSAVCSCRCSRHAIRPARAAEGDPMQVWASLIVSLPALPSPGPWSTLPPSFPAPLSCLPVPALHRPILRSATSEGDPDSHPWGFFKLLDPCGVFFDFLPLVLCTQVYGVVYFCFRI